MSGQAVLIAAADHAARHWRFPEPGPLRAGTDRHRQAVCRMFHETFNPYKPSVIDWPRLDPAALQRLTSLPIWDIAVQTEGKARLRMQRYAESLPDKAWRDALELNAWEEGRHKEVLSSLVRAAEASPAALMAVCLTENDRRFAGYDPRLLRPATTPAIARLVCWFAGRRHRREGVGR
jgi:hypothetical protein